MNEEKMTILKMLEEGRIGAAEAARLLSAVGDEKPRKAPKLEKAPPSPGTRAYNSQTPPKTRGHGEFTSDLSKKFETFARDMEPKLQKFTENIAGAADMMTDKISKTIGNAAAPPAREAHRNISSGTTERVFEYTVSPGFNELNLAGLNGDVTIKGYNGDKISAKVCYAPKRPGADIEIMRLGNKYFLNYEEDEFQKVSIDAYIPSAMFDNIALSTVNAALDVSAVNAANLNINTLNGPSALKDIEAGTLKADCSNGPLKLTQIKAENADIEISNGGVTALGADIKNLSLSALNGQININIADLSAYGDYIWAVETSNAKLTLNMPSAPDYGYHIKAHATFSNIKIGLTGLNYTINDGAYAEAKSVHYDKAGKRIKLSLETSNAPLVIN